MSRFVGNHWTLSIEDFIPKLNKKADIVACKLTKSGEIDARFGAVAIEVKPNGQINGLEQDLKKLSSYVRRSTNEVNFGILVYLSRLDKHEKTLRDRARKRDRDKIAVVRIDPRGPR